MTTQPTPSFSASRRTIVLALAVAPIVPYLRAYAVEVAPPAAGTFDLKSFLQLSQVLTNRPTLDAVTGGRALANLSAEDKGFSAQASALFAAITAAKFTDMRAFNTFIAGHEALRPVAMKIISAWYLGYTGHPSGNSFDDNARFVSYAGALMYQPTIDATVVPSYSRGHTNYWAHPPATLATD